MTSESMQSRTDIQILALLRAMHELLEIYLHLSSD